MAAAGAPVGYYVPDGDIFVIPYDAVPMSDAPHPNAAQVFVDFLLSEQGQQALVEGGHVVSSLVTYTDVAIPGAVDREPEQIASAVGQPDRSSEAEQLFDLYLRN